MNSFENRQQTTPDVTTFSKNGWTGGEILPLENDYIWQGSQLSKDYGSQEDRQYILHFRAKVESGVPILVQSGSVARVIGHGTSEWTDYGTTIVPTNNRHLNIAIKLHTTDQQNTIFHVEKVELRIGNYVQLTEPGNGYRTDLQIDGEWRKAIKFTEGSLSFFDTYDLVLEGVTYQNPELMIAENCVLIPANEKDIAWNSRIGVYGANGAEASKQLFLDGDAVRPYGGVLDNTLDKTRVIFEGGNVGRYANYGVKISGTEHGGLIISSEDNSITLPFKIIDNSRVEVYGLNDTGLIKTIVFEDDGNTTPLFGWVVFHGNSSTCVMFRSGDLTEFAAGYRLYYKGTSTTQTIGITPNHIRYEIVGENILTEISLYSTTTNGEDERLLFKGRYNNEGNNSHQRNTCLNPSKARY